MNAAAVTPAFTPINPNGLPHACSSIRIINTSNIDIIISFDGHTQHEVVIANQTLMLPFQFNAQPGAWVSLLAAGTKVYVLAAAPGIGSIILTGYYV
jgi:hypothetical protein